MKLSATEQNTLRKSAAQKICGFFGFDSHSLAVYGTSYGFSVDSMRGTSPLFGAISNLLASRGIRFKTASGGLHDEIRVSSRGDNLQKFDALAAECWNRVQEIEGVMMDKYLELARSVDREPLKAHHPHCNSVVSVLAVAESRVRQFREDSKWFDVKTEIKDIESLLKIQNDVDACRKVLREWRDAPLSSKTVSVGLSILAGAELERLTGEKID